MGSDKPFQEPVVLLDVSFRPNVELMRAMARDLGFSTPRTEKSMLSSPKGSVMEATGKGSETVSVTLVSDPLEEAKRLLVDVEEYVGRVRREIEEEGDAKAALEYAEDTKTSLDRLVEALTSVQNP